ncbi:AlbA family DNA-binding domain-containing protein [Arthrobacter sp. MDT1-65]
MSHSALHRALGFHNHELTLDDIRLTIDQGIQERDDLDWKKHLPAKQPNAAQIAAGKDFAPDREFAKDVAAMANSGGGTIVFGIEEDRATSAAKAIAGVGEWSDSIERKLRSWAASTIQPPVYDLDITRIGSGEETIVIVNVSGSPQAPHFVTWGAGTDRVPRRTGTKTVFMAEREIEAAYRARFRGEADRENVMLAHVRRAALRVQGDGLTAGLALVAMPVGERQALRGPIAACEFQAILAAMNTANRFFVSSFEAMGILGQEPRRGLRRWLVQYPRTGGETLLEVHDNGTLVLAQKCRPQRDPEDLMIDVDADAVHYLPAYMAQLVEAAAEILGLPGDYEVRFLMTTSASGMWIRQPRGGFAMDREELLPIIDPEPIDAVFTATPDRDVQLTQLNGLVMDVLNSGGISRVWRPILNIPLQALAADDDGHS